MPTEVCRYRTTVVPAPISYVPIRFHELWWRERSNLPLDKAVIGAVEAHLRTVPIA